MPTGPFKKIITALSLSLFLVACSSFEDLTEAKSMVKQENYEKAIDILDDYKSQRAKSYNSQVHLDYAVYKLKDLKIDKLQRYKEAKDLLAEALELDKKNLIARNYYLMISKTINYEFHSTAN